MYSDIVIDHFKNPRNVGVIKDANIVVKVGDPSCGDALLVFFKIADDRVQDIKYKIYGCGAAIATSSIASEMAMGKTLDEVLEITEESITLALNGLPAEKRHCSNLAASAFHAAVNEYRKAPAPTPKSG
jgi:nitrogen fixation NifU-like protein